MHVDTRRVVYIIFLTGVANMDTILLRSLRRDDVPWPKEVVRGFC